MKVKRFLMLEVETDRWVSATFNRRIREETERGAIIKSQWLTEKELYDKMEVKLRKAKKRRLRSE